MKRFYKDVAVVPAGKNWCIQLDGRPVKTQEGQPQAIPSEALARAMAREWEEQGEEIDPSRFHHRDLADYALDVLARDREAAVEKLLSFAATDTLCYRADPEDALYRRQQEVWEPLVRDFEAREGVALTRVSGIIHRPQKGATTRTLRARLEALDIFSLAALESLTSLSASLCIGLSALEPGADGEALWNSANLEEDWQAEQWGTDEEAAAKRDKRKREFLSAMEFAQLL